MRAIFGVLGLLIVLVVVGVLAKKQLGALSLVPPQNPAAANAGVTLPATSPGATPQAQSQQIQQQIKQSVEAAMQQPRPMPEEQ
ncbi:hypothetical protein [Polaromonas sp.]|uniref:hypothetical protein n=1 Tax=Polaromonas sp. TaxID=1869339 RepID=UPI001790FE28|nr:hypothetical protein [Polaromonas sp.]NML86715.1 hypothetical protein [Polaromonas sp.]